MKLLHSKYQSLLLKVQQLAEILGYLHSLHHELCYAASISPRKVQSRRYHRRKDLVRLVSVTQKAFDDPFFLYSLVQKAKNRKLKASKNKKTTS